VAVAFAFSRPDEEREYSGLFILNYTSGYAAARSQPLAGEEA